MGRKGQYMNNTLSKNEVFIFQIERTKKYVENVENAKNNLQFRIKNCNAQQKLDEK